MIASETENALLINLGKGRQDAFDPFYHAFKTRVYRIAFSYFNNQEDAEEITQDIFLKIYNSAHQFNQKSSAATWVYRIAVNKCLDKLRFNNAKKRFAFFTSFFSGENESVKEVGDLSNHGIEADKREDVKLLLLALDKLPLQQKTALLLTQIEELSGKEAASIMNVTPKAIEGLIQRGKANLRKILEKYYREQGI